MTWRPWRVAMADALYGPAGFYRQHRPEDHFLTAPALAPFATAVRELAGRVDDALGRPDPFDVADLGAGSGRLLEALPDVPGRWRLTGVELRPGPPGVARWAGELPRLTGLLFANEWLDNVPLDVAEGGRLVEVDGDGSERPGPRLTGPPAEWLAAWWPQGSGARAEIGLTRDVAWAGAVARVRRGLAVAVDYGHLVGDRRPTLTGYRAGRQVAPVPDGRSDLTAHVALDSCAAAAGGRLLRQREALRRLGVRGQFPTASQGTAGLRAALERSSQEARLLDPAGLGGFGWLVTAVGMTDPLTLPQ